MPFCLECDDSYISLGYCVHCPESLFSSLSRRRGKRYGVVLHATSSRVRRDDSHMGYMHERQTYQAGKTYAGLP